MKQFLHAVYIIFTLILVSVLVKVYPFNEMNIEEILELRYVTIFWIMISIPYGIWLKYSSDKPTKRKSPTDQ